MTERAEPTRFEFGLSASPSEPLRDWEPIARHWHARTARLLQQCGGVDAPFVHAEHGNMHNFLLAAELSGTATLREVIGSRGQSGGRLDAVLLHDGRRDFIEAKFAEFRLNADGSPSPGALAKCERHLSDAQEQVRVWWNEHPMYLDTRLSERRIALLFVAAHLPNFSEEGDVRLTRYVDAMRTIRHDFLTWSFPGSARMFSYWGRHYPGVIALARLA